MKKRDDDELQFPSFDLNAYARAEPSQYTGEAQDRDRLTGEILAWRCWRLDNRYPFGGEPEPHPCLYSCWMPLAWTGPVVRADKVPSKENIHGIYCFRDIPTGQNQGTRDHQEYVATYPAFGIVALSGRILVGSMGYRAERAVVRHVWINPNSHSLLLRLLGGPTNINFDSHPHPKGDVQYLAQRYACEVEVHDKWYQVDKWRKVYKRLKQ